MKRTVLLCLVLVALLSACGGSATSLSGVTWTVTSLSGVDADPSVTMTANFGSDNRLTGNGGCNEYSAGYTVSGSTLTIDSPTSSMMSCNEMADQRKANTSTFWKTAAATRSRAAS